MLLLLRLLLWNGNTASVRIYLCTFCFFEMNLPPPALPPSDMALREGILSVCENIARGGDDVENAYREQVYSTFEGVKW